MDVQQEPITNEALAAKIDIIGQQMNWLCENLMQVFSFTQAMSQNGGGVRGIMKALKEQQAQPVIVEEDGSEVS